MKLYDSKLSPYSSRVRLQLYFKNLSVEVIDVPSGGSHTAEYAKMNPLEKIPTLEDSGFFLPESSAIGEYLEDTGAGRSLRPESPKERARMRVIYNVADQYILTPLFELFEQVNPATRNPKVVDEQLTELRKALSGLEKFLAGGKYALGSDPSLADCALVPALFFVSAVSSGLGQGDLLAATPKVKAYYSDVQSDPSVQRLLAELGTALVEYMKQAS
ncbi:MAG: glutathione S-transferase family protein [Micropepsaceae bacterium]